jgi:hypothetical protein
MTTKRETVLQALFAAVQGTGLQVVRNDAKPQDVPATGALVLHDGEPGEPETTLSPLTWHYLHRAQIDLFAVDGDDPRDEVFDAAVTLIGAALAADRTLGGTCDWVEPEAPAAVPLEETGGQPVKSAAITVVLHYSTTDPLG